MASNTTESTPLLQPNNPQQAPPARPQRNVTFSPTVSTDAPPSSAPLRPTTSATPGASSTQPRSGDARPGQPVLQALNSKLRRRHSHGAALAQQLPAPPKIGAQRTTKHAQKLKLLPNPDQGGEDADEESGRDVYSQFTRIKDPMARRDAARLGKDDRKRLPRVTAYCTANSYKLEDLVRFFRSRGRVRGAAPKLFDECIYTPFTYAADAEWERTSDRVRSPPRSDNPPRRFSDSEVDTEEAGKSREHNPAETRRDSDGDSRYQVGHAESSQQAFEEQPESSKRDRHENADFDTHVHIPEIFLFNYGTVVIWGMTLKEEQRFLKDISKFEQEKLEKEDVQAENFNFYYTQGYQARIYNDFISLRDKKNYMTKLAISHALSQSVKTSLYEDLVDNTIDTTKEIPSQLATTGKTGMSRRQIAMQIGELFILRINIHLQGSVLDSPELMWAEPGLEPVYNAVRSYLELNSRCTLLTERLDVIADLLAILKDQSSHRHGEFLEWIVIVLIAAEIFVAAINIVVDLYADAGVGA